MTLSTSEARIAYDVGMHAANQAMETLMRVCQPAGQKLSVAAACAAFAMIKYKIEMVCEAMEPVQPGFGTSVEQAAAILRDKEGDKFKEFAAAKREEMGL